MVTFDILLYSHSSVAFCTPTFVPEWLASSLLESHPILELPPGLKYGNIVLWRLDVASCQMCEHSQRSVPIHQWKAGHYVHYPIDRQGDWK